MIFRSLMGMFLGIIISVLPVQTALADNDSFETSQTVAKTFSMEIQAAVHKIFDLALSEYNFGYIEIIIHEASKDAGIGSGPWREYEFEGMRCHLTFRFNKSIILINQSCIRSNVKKTTISYFIYDIARNGIMYIP
jgi:hypothetical protein